MRIPIIPAVLMAAMVSSTAWAGTLEPIDVTNVSMPSMPILHITAPGVSLNAYVGPFSLNYAYQPNTWWDPAWCIDLYHDIALGGQNPAINYTIHAFEYDAYFADTSREKQGLIAGLMEKGNIMLTTGYEPEVGTLIQLAIWSVQYGDSFSYTGLNDAGRAMVNSWIAEAPTSNHGLVLSDGGQHQTLGQIPEPMSITLLGAGILGLGMIRRRTR